MLGSATSAIEPPARPLRREPPWRSFVEHPTYVGLSIPIPSSTAMTGASAMRYRMNTVMLCLAPNRSKHGWQAADPRTDHGGFPDLLVRPGGNQGRNGEKERQPRCRDPVQISQQARADGCPGTRHTGNQGNSTERRDVVQPAEPASVPGRNHPRSPGSPSRPGRSRPAVAARPRLFQIARARSHPTRARPAG